MPRGRYIEMLTYKLFVFQCINSYFSLFFIAFLKPFGVQLFGIDVGRCLVAPPPGVPSCADELRTLLHSVLFLNIVVGQATEVGSLFVKGIGTRFAAKINGCCLTRRKGVMQATDAHASSAAPSSFNSSTRILPPVGSDEEEKVRELIREFELPPLKSVQQGLGNTYYEYNEMALQYGYVTCFAIAAPIAPVLALANNLVEIRTDFFKMIALTRRTQAEDTVVGIGPWERALKALSFVAVLVNLGFLGLTSGFFERLSHYEPAFRSTWPRIVALIVAEHALLALKMFVDWVVPDVPDAVRIEVERDEFIQERVMRDPSDPAPEAPPATMEARPVPSVNVDEVLTVFRF